MKSKLLLLSLVTLSGIQAQDNQTQSKFHTRHIDRDIHWSLVPYEEEEKSYIISPDSYDCRKHNYAHSKVEKTELKNHLSTSQLFINAAKNLTLGYAQYQGMLGAATMAHELSHAAVLAAGGSRIATGGLTFPKNSFLRGPSGYVEYELPNVSVIDRVRYVRKQVTVDPADVIRRNHIAGLAAGPLGGIAGTFLILKIPNIIREYKKNNNIASALSEGLKQPIAWSELSLPAFVAGHVALYIQMDNLLPHDPEWDGWKIKNYMKNGYLRKAYTPSVKAGMAGLAAYAAMNWFNYSYACIDKLLQDDK